MTELQKVIKYLAIALAVFLIVSIVGGAVSVVRLVAGLFDRDSATADFISYSVSGEFHSLDIEIGVADLNIREGEAFSVESNLKHLHVKVEDGVLKIDESEWKKSFSAYHDPALTVYVPAGTLFREVSMTTGAGRLTAEELSAEYLDLKLGAGEVSFGSLKATASADIEGGAGRVTISNGVLSNLDLDMGAGQLELTSALTGDCELNLGVGESRINLIGDRDDYRLMLEKGLGSISVEGEKMPEGGRVGDGANRVKVSGGVGAIYVRYEAVP